MNPIVGNKVNVLIILNRGVINQIPLVKMWDALGMVMNISKGKFGLLFIVCFIYLPTAYFLPEFWILLTFSVILGAPIHFFREMKWMSWNRVDRDANIKEEDFKEWNKKYHSLITILFIILILVGISYPIALTTLADRYISKNHIENIEYYNGDYFEERYKIHTGSKFINLIFNSFANIVFAAILVNGALIYFIHNHGRIKYYKRKVYQIEREVMRLRYK